MVDHSSSSERDLRVKPPIHQALATDVAQDVRGTVGVVEAERLAGVPAKIELRRVALEVLFADAVERAVEAALEDRERGFDGVRGDIAARVRPISSQYFSATNLLAYGCGLNEARGIKPQCEACDGPWISRYLGSIRVLAAE